MRKVALRLKTISDVMQKVDDPQRLNAFASRMAARRAKAPVGSRIHSELDVAEGAAHLRRNQLMKPSFKAPTIPELTAPYGSTLDEVARHASKVRAQQAAQAAGKKSRFGGRGAPATLAESPKARRVVVGSNKSVKPQAVRDTHPQSLAYAPTMSMPSAGARQVKIATIQGFSDELISCLETLKWH